MVDIKKTPSTASAANPKEPGARNSSVRSRSDKPFGSVDNTTFGPGLVNRPLNTTTCSQNLETPSTASAANPNEPGARSFSKISSENEVDGINNTTDNLVQAYWTDETNAIFNECCAKDKRNIQIIAGSEFEAALDAASKLSAKMKDRRSTALETALVQSGKAKDRATQLAANLDKMVRSAKAAFDKSDHARPLRVVLDELQYTIEQAVCELKSAISEASSAADRVHQLASLEADDLKRFHQDAKDVHMKIGFATSAVTLVLAGLDNLGDLSIIADCKLRNANNPRWEPMSHETDTVDSSQLPKLNSSQLRKLNSLPPYDYKSSETDTVDSSQLPKLNSSQLRKLNSLPPYDYESSETDTVDSSQPQDLNSSQLRKLNSLPPYDYESSYWYGYR